MKEGGGVIGLEEYIAGVSFCTARSAPEYSAVFQLDIQPDMKVLDVGAGGSDFTARLLELGIDAYAVDPIYKARSQVRGKVEEYNKILLKSATSPQVRKGFIQRAVRARETVERFSESVRLNPSHYIPEFVLSMSFPEDTFDRVYSNNCVTEWMDGTDSLLFLGAVGQLIRVTKPGGKIQLYPFVEKGEAPKGIKPAVSPEELERRYAKRDANHRQLLEVLRAAQIPFGSFQGDAQSRTLIIEKPVVKDLFAPEAEGNESEEGLLSTPVALVVGDGIEF